MALTAVQLERHKRHLLVHDIGGPGVQKLVGAKVSIVGAGALGGPCAMYLAAAGVGEIHIYDDDVVDLSNLQRQVQFSEADLGHSKAETLAFQLSRMNGTIRAIPHTLRVAEETELECEIIIDATDNFEARYALNDISREISVPLVSGAANIWAGQVSVFASGIDPDQPCYRCWVPELPENAENCDTLGVVGPVTGMVATRMALETIKLITGAGPALIGKLWILDGRSGDARTIKLRKDQACQACGPVSFL
ncbi:MAG: HesA/MoeB/ThiF family protein [Pseudomonadota bacterium]